MDKAPWSLGWMFPDPVKVHNLSDGMRAQVTKSVALDLQRLFNQVDNLQSES